MSLSTRVLLHLRQQFLTIAYYGEGATATLPMRMNIRDERIIRRWMRSQGIKSHIEMSAVHGKFYKAITFTVPPRW